MKFLNIFLIVFIGLCQNSNSQPTIKILPWNGHRAAVSLTFDDALLIHLIKVAPDLEKHNLRGTFFLIGNKVKTKEDIRKWKDLTKKGNELGNHSLTHANLINLTQTEIEKEITSSRNLLEEKLKIPINTFAYPYSVMDKNVRDIVVENSFAARTWQASTPNTPFLIPGCGLDWFAIPSKAVHTTTSPKDVEDWIDTDLQLKAWIIFQIHGIGDPSTGFDPIPIESWNALLNKLNQAQDEGLWVAPFGEVAAYWKSSEIFEESKFIDIGNNSYEKHWILPNNFKKGQVIKIIFKNSIKQVFQNKKLLQPINGVYLISIDEKELVVSQ